MPTAQKIYAVSVKNEVVTTAMFMKCSRLYSEYIFLSNERKWLRTSYLDVTPPSTNHVQINPDFLTVYFSDWANMMRKCSVPQRQVGRVFWFFLIIVWLAWFFFVMYACMQKNLGQMCSLKNPIQLHSLNLILMLYSYQKCFLVPQNTVP